MKIVDKELCSGCGACAAVDARALHMGWNEEGFFFSLFGTKDSKEC